MRENCAKCGKPATMYYNPFADATANLGPTTMVPVCAFCWPGLKQEAIEKAKAETEAGNCRIL